MKKFILILALCFMLMFAVAAVSAQEAEETPVVSEETVEVPAETAEETTEAPVETAEGTEEADECFKVTYAENDCLAVVPCDNATYAAGEEVTVLFEPVQYKDYLIFYGWDWDDDGIADFGYNYNTFKMPEGDVELKAICIAPYGGASCPGCHLHGIPTWGSFSGFGFYGPNCLIP